MERCPSSRWQRTVTPPYLADNVLLLQNTPLDRHENARTRVMLEAQFFYPDAHRAMADQEVDVGNAVKPTLTSFITKKESSL